MKKLLFFICLILFFGTMAYYSPHFLFYRLVNHKMEESFYNKTELFPIYLKGEIRVLEDYRSHIVREKYWKSFHYENYELLLPVNDPYVSFVPTLDDKDILGLEFHSPNKSPLLKIHFKKPFYFQRKIENTGFFSIPIVSYWLDDIPTEYIWKDLFTQSIPVDIGSILKKSYFDLIYDLYIIYLRNRLFPKDLNAYYFNPSMNHYVWSLVPGHDHILFFVNDTIYGYQAISSLQNSEAILVKDRFFSTTSYKQRNQKEQKELYETFVALDYPLKFKDEGITLLISSWSQFKENKVFLRELIRYIEKSENRLEQLWPIYEYAQILFQDDLKAVRQSDDSTPDSSEGPKTDHHENLPDQEAGEDRLPKGP